MPLFNNVCQACAHHSGDRTCSAFPASIPDHIWQGRSPHTKRSPLQVGDDVLAVQDPPSRDYLVEIGLVQAGQAKLARQSDSVSDAELDPAPVPQVTLPT